MRAETSTGAPSGASARSPASACELEQRERVAGGGVVQALGHAGREASEERRRLVAGQAAEPQRRQIGAVEQRRVAFAHRDQDRDRIGHQPAEREQQRLGARAVEPVGVVDEHRDRAVLGVGGEQAERGRADREPLLGRAWPQRQRALERDRLRLRDLVEHHQRRAQQLEQRRERDLGLGLDPARAQHPHPAGRSAAWSSSTVLPIPGSPTSASVALAPDARARQHALDLLSLAVTTEQHRPNPSPRCRRAPAGRRLGAPRKRCRPPQT